LVGYVARMGDMRNIYKILVGNPEEKRALRRHRCRCYDNIKLDFKEIGIMRTGFNGLKIWFRGGLS